MPKAAELRSINIEEEMKNSYLDYAMSVIIGRALPDIRDGLKPVHRRILYAMYREGLLSAKRYSKCAGVVGEVLKKYHPHGDVAVYESLVRMAQGWNMRAALIDGQGNFGSQDGDPPAAYRYTECRLTKLAEEMLEDIDKETVDFVPNFDASTTEPLVLPSKVPNLLVNGSDGIAVGMATKIPPHNLGEIIGGLVGLIDQPNLSVKDLMKFIPGPDFPTGAFIYGLGGIQEAYQTGKGIIQMRARTLVEKLKGEREAIIVTEIPYQVNKAKLIERIAELTNEGKLDGISDIRDESDREGMRIVIELKRGATTSVVLNQLYKHTPMQSSFGTITLAIVAGQPKIVDLKQALSFFIDHRREVVTRKTAYDLKKAEERSHILEGLKKALENIDEIIALIKKSREPQAARETLMLRYKFTEIQAQAILEMRLQRLTGLERNKIMEEFGELQKQIKEFKTILADERRVLGLIKAELLELKKNYGDARRTEIIAKTEEVREEELIQEEDMVVTISHGGYIKRNVVSLYRAQRRGGRGKTGMATREEDFVEELFIASTRSYLLIFTTSGKVHWLKVYEIPQAGRVTRGKAITSLVQIPSDDQVAAVLPIKNFEAGPFVVMVTKKGTIKKTELPAFSHPRAGGIIAIGLDEGDKVVAVTLTTASQQIVLSTRNGKAIRFPEEDVRDMGRQAYGVRGIHLGEKDEVVSLEVLGTAKSTLLTVTERGYGKRTEIEEYRVQSRGGTGIFTCKIIDKNGPVVGVLQVQEGEDVMLVTSQGKIIRTAAKDISIQGRATQGVRLISLEGQERVTSVAKLAEKEEEEDKNGGGKNVGDH